MRDLPDSCAQNVQPRGIRLQRDTLYRQISVTLSGLVGPDIENILGIKRGSTTAQRADVRKRRYEAVQAYASSLLFSRGLLG